MSDSVFVHPQAICESSEVGAGTTIWAFAHVLPGAAIGRECNICDGVFIENDVVVGDRVTIKSGVQLWDGLRIGDDVFLGPNATFTNDLFPRSKVHSKPVAVTVIHHGASIGANATVLAGVEIGQNAMVGAGAVVTEPVPANAKVVGNPGRIIGYADDLRPERDRAAAARQVPAVSAERLPTGVELVDIPNHVDLRGSLAVLELNDVPPFVPRRAFTIYDVPSRHVRGEHAHRSCWQFLTCLAGSLLVHVDDGHHRAEVPLDSPARGVVIPPLVWASQFRYSPDAVLLVLASAPYDPADYIRDYGTFLATVRDSYSQR